MAGEPDMSAIVANSRGGALPGRSDLESVIEVRGVSHQFGGVTAIDDVSLEVKRGQFVSLVGPTGCGKTTLLYILSGLEPLQSGEVTVAGKPPRAGDPAIGYAFPRDALLAWRTAIQNVALPLELRGVPRRARLEQAAAVLERVGLGHAQQLYRAELSQGMRQRVALARTLVSKPSILFMDEPFGALDAQTRLLMQNELLSLLRDEDATVVFVTHDLDEAISLSDMVLVLSQRPCRVLRRVNVPFARPRAITQLRQDEHYQDLYAEVWETLGGEVSATFGQENRRD